MKLLIKYVPAIILGAFALLTLFLSSSVILDLFGIREKEGNYVLFIVWANFISSILYLFAVNGFIKQNKNTLYFLLTALVILIIAFISLKIHVNSGGLYEEKTCKAMLFRMSITAIFTTVAYITIWRTKHLTS
ncbi:MAG TPA: hypothetical protein EYG80_06945 [Flavobacteriaceae bacterium]|nr:hypothetical protein [Flavobacteriaceae bacterium]